MRKIPKGSLSTWSSSKIATEALEATEERVGMAELEGMEGTEDKAVVDMGTGTGTENTDTGTVVMATGEDEKNAQLHDALQLGRYHEAVLSHGTLPVKYLPELVRRTRGPAE